MEHLKNVDNKNTQAVGIETKKDISEKVEANVVKDVKSVETEETIQRKANLAKYIERQKIEKQAKELKLNKLVEIGKSINKQDALKFLVDTYANDTEQLYWDDLDNVQNGKITDPNLIKAIDTYGKVTKKGDKPNYEGYYAYRLEQVSGTK